MITDQLMSIAFSKGTMEFYHNSQMGDLTNLFKLGSEYRISKKKTAVNMSIFLNSDKTKEMVSIIAEDLDIDTKDVVYSNGKKGKASRTFGNLYFIIYCAEHLDPNFHLEVIKVFVESKVQILRDDGGNDFKSLNQLIDTLEDRTIELKPKGNSGCYINIAKLLKEKIFPLAMIADTKGMNIWNTHYATSDKQDKRTRYESQLVSAIQLGFIKTYPQLKETIERL